MTTRYPSIPVPQNNLDSIYSAFLMARQTINLLTVNAQKSGASAVSKGAQVFTTADHTHPPTTATTPASFPAPPVNAANDTIAAAAGVPIGGIYRHGSVLMVRVS